MDNKTAKSVEDSFKAELDRATAEGATGTKPKDSPAPESPQTTVTMYKLPDGRELPADQVLAEYNNLHKDYTQKTQKLSELEKRATTQDNSQTDPKTPIAPSQGDNNQPVTSEVDQRMIAELKRLGVVLQPDLNSTLDKTFQQKEQEIVQKSSQFTESKLDVKAKFDAIEANFNGENGKPKVERGRVLDWINERKQYNLTPEEATNLVYHEDMVKYQARVLAEGANPNLPVTERSGANVTTPPNPPVYSFKDGSAERAARELLGGVR